LSLSNLMKLNNPADSSDSTDQMRAKSRSKKRKSIKSVCAVFIHAELFIMDIFEDGKAVEDSFKQAFAASEDSMEK
jgi:hypothetical protein